KSGTSVLSGPTTKRISCSLGNRSRVTMQRRSGPVSASSSIVCSAASVVLRLLRGFRGKPVGTGRHDDVVGGGLVHGLRADNLDQLVGRQVGEVVQGLH